MNAHVVVGQGRCACVMYCVCVCVSVLTEGEECVRVCKGHMYSRGAARLKQMNSPESFLLSMSILKLKLTQVTSLMHRGLCHSKDISSKCSNRYELELSPDLSVACVRNLSHTLPSTLPCPRAAPCSAKKKKRKR